jgi:uncharacterized phage-associated protein
MNVNGKSDRGQSRSADRTTVSSTHINGAEAIMPFGVTAPQRAAVIKAGLQYVAAMTTSAHLVIDAIEARRPGLSDTKRNLLLFFVQGHHLAHSGDALFAEALYATDRGVDIDDTSEDAESTPLGNGALNTVGDVLARYGDLSPADLRTLVQASVPWQLAIKSTLGPRIEWAWLRDWFRRPDETDDPEDDRPTKAMMAAWLARPGARQT